MMGWRRIFPPVITAALAEDVPKAAGLTEFVRCRIRQEEGQYVVSSTGSQSSGVLSSLSQGGGLIVGPSEPKVLSRGAEVKVIVLNEEELAAEEVPF